MLLRAVGGCVRHAVKPRTVQVSPLCCHYASRSSDFDLLPHIRRRIEINGPLTIADYMREVLTNPQAGYYMNRDVFGVSGDFITSPEISQMFGELLGIWCVNEWMNCGSPDHIQVIELGPGRGTLAEDMLRTFSKFEGIRDAASLHLVEVSPWLSQMQYNKLTGSTDHSASATDHTLSTTVQKDSDHKFYKSGTSRYGSPIYWYQQLPDVPRALSFIIAHEFFDALPIHKFQKKDGKWREVMVDFDDSVTDVTKLRYVLSPGDTYASSLLLKSALSENDQRDHVEVCPEGGVLAQELANRIALDGGFGLIADYGHTGDKGDTFRAFHKHKLHDPLHNPGDADLTADVDFSYLSRMIDDRVCVHGPVTQSSFLHNMGIGVRLEVLMEKASVEQRKDLITGYDMLTNPRKMGERFKFMALLRERPNNYKPAGFSQPT